MANEPLDSASRARSPQVPSVTADSVLAELKEWVFGRNRSYDDRFRSVYDTSQQSPLDLEIAIAAADSARIIALAEVVRVLWQEPVLLEVQPGELVGDQSVLPCATVESTDDTPDIGSEEYLKRLCGAVLDNATRMRQVDGFGIPALAVSTRDILDVFHRFGLPRDA